MDKKGIIAIVVLALSTILLTTYIVYDKLSQKKEEKNTTITIDNRDVMINDMFEINEIVNTFDKAFNDLTTNYFGYLYKTKLYAKNFEKDAALYVSMYDEMEKSNIVQTIRESKIISNFNKIFGDNLKYKRAELNIGEGYKTEFGTTPYLAYIAPTKTNDLYAPEYIGITTKTNLEEDKILLTRKFFYVEYEQNENTKEVTIAKIYRSPKKEKLLGRVNLKNGEINKEQIIGSYGSKFDTYIYTFIYQKSKYSFYKINKK